MIKATDLIAGFQRAYDEGWGYIWGTWGKLWTEADQARIEKTTADKYKLARQYGKKWIGHRVSDCSGLFRRVYYDLGITNMSHVVKYIWKSWTTKRGQLKSGKRTDGKALKPGTAVFTGTVDNHPHIGLYIDGWVIEAMGTKNGVIRSRITDKKWTFWGELKEVEYDMTDNDNQGFPDTSVWHPTLRRGSKGDDVRELQKLLKTLGYSLGSYGVDGDYGRATEAAVKKFQDDHKLTADGVCGPLTWDALEKATDAPAEPDPAKSYSVIIRGLDLTQAKAIAAQYTGMAEIVEGGDA